MRRKLSPQLCEVSHDGSILVVLRQLQNDKLMDRRPLVWHVYVSLARGIDDLPHADFESRVKPVRLMKVIVAIELLSKPLLGDNTGLKLQTGCVRIVLKHLWLGMVRVPFKFVCIRDLMSNDIGSTNLRLDFRAGPGKVESTLQVRLALSERLRNGLSQIRLYAKHFK